MKKPICITAIALLILVILNVSGCSMLKPSKQDYSGTWKGMLQFPNGGEQRAQLNISKNSDGTLSATADSPDQGAFGIVVDKISIDNNLMRFEINSLSGFYEGKLVDGSMTIDGNWHQDDTVFPLIFKKEK